MKPIDKKSLDSSLAKLSDAIEYIEDPSIKAMILQFATMYNKRVLRTIEQSQFKKRNQAIEELDALVERCQSQLDKAYESGIGVSAAEDALRSAWKVRDAAVDQLIQPVDLESAELYVDTAEFDNQDL